MRTTYRSGIVTDVGIEPARGVRLHRARFLGEPAPSELDAPPAGTLASRSSVVAAASASGYRRPLVYWDGDELRELEDNAAIDKGDGTRRFTCTDCMSNNNIKATPSLTADLFGDWREEVVWRTPGSSALRVYTTTSPTTRRIYTLMHAPQYRMQVTSEQTGLTRRKTR